MRLEAALVFAPSEELEEFFKVSTFFLTGRALLHALLIGGDVDLILGNSRWLHGGHLFDRWLVRVIHLDLGELE